MILIYTFSYHFNYANKPSVYSNAFLSLLTVVDFQIDSWHCWSLGSHREETCRFECGRNSYQKGKGVKEPTANEDVVTPG